MPNPTPRHRLPATRQSLTHRFVIGNHKGYITVGLYDDGRPGELFIRMGGVGSLERGLLSAVGILASMLLQAGVPLKEIENRTWPLPRSMRGQRVAIHASGRRDLDECWKASALINATPSLSEIHFPPIRLAFRGRGFIVRSWPSELATSAIIGTVEIVDCVTASDSPWFAGPYGFVLRDPRPLAEPIPCRGWLGFWTVPSEIERQILEAERRAA